MVALETPHRHSHPRDRTRRVASTVHDYYWGCAVAILGDEPAAPSSEVDALSEFALNDLSVDAFASDQAEDTGGGVDRPDLGWYARLGRVLSELGWVSTLEAVTEVVMSRAADAVDATVASLWRVDEDGATMSLLATRGVADGVKQQWQTTPVAADNPACEALRQRAPLILSGRDAIAHQYPDVALMLDRDDISLLCLPLLAGDRPIGVLGLRFTRIWHPDAAQLDYLQLVASSCAQAIQRVDAMARAAQKAVNLEFLAEASEALAASLDYRTTLAQVARLAVPTLGDWCAVEILEDGFLHGLAVEHVDPQRVELARELQRKYPTDPDSPTGAPNVARTGITEFYADISDEMLVAATRDDEHLRLARALGLRSGMTVPLVARDRVLGVITLMSAESGRRYGPDDVRLAEDLARRAALAIDNAQLFSQTRDVATELQHAVLPAPFPHHPRWDVATHYQPAGRTEVGGDFYDAMLLDDHRLLAVIGDVMGRGVEAAAAMAQMRSAVLAYSAVDPDPIVILTKLDRMFAQHRITRLVTIVVALIDTGTGTVTIANGGHLPPLVISSGQQVTVAHPHVPGRLLGVQPQPRTATTLPFPSGTTLLLYTDGLVERRAESLTESIDRLVAAAGHHTWRTPQTALDQLTAQLVDNVRDDDVTAISVTSRLHT